MNNQETILEIMARYFKENTYMDAKDFYVFTGIKTREERLNSAPVQEKTDD